MHCTPRLHREGKVMKEEEGGGPGAAPHLSRPQVPGPAGADEIGPFPGSWMTMGALGVSGVSPSTLREDRERGMGCAGGAVSRLNPETRRRRRLFLRREDGSGDGGELLN